MRKVKITKVDVFIAVSIGVIVLTVAVPAITPPGQSTFSSSTLINVTATAQPALHQYVQYLRNYFGGWHAYFIILASIADMSLATYSLGLVTEDAVKKGIEARGDSQ